MRRSGAHGCGRAFGAARAGNAMARGGMVPPGQAPPGKWLVDLDPARCERRGSLGV